MADEGIDRALVIAASSGPAAWVDRFVVGCGLATLRMAFLERVAVDIPDDARNLKDPYLFRSAVVMSYGDAVALKNLLTTVLDNVEKQAKQVMQ